MNNSPSTSLNSLRWDAGWRPSSLIAGFFLLAIGILYWPTYAGIFAVWWHNETFAHGFLIPLIIAYLLWEKRTEVATVSPQPAPLAVLFSLTWSFLWLLGYIADIAVVQQFAVVAMLPTLVWLVFGNSVAAKIMFPLGYFIFAVPLGEFLVPVLQNFTAAFVVKILQLTGVPVLWEGLFFYLPTGSFEVAKACSGVRYLIASLALGTLYAYITYTSQWRRLLFIGLALIVPIIANGIRAYGIVMMAYLSDYKLAAGVDHILYGWLFFGLVMFVMFWIGSLFKDSSAKERPVEDLQNTESTAEVSQNLSESSNGVVVLDQVTTPGHAKVNMSNNTALRTGVWVVLALAVTASAPGLATWLDARASQVVPSVVVLPIGVSGWEGPRHVEVESKNAWRPQFPGATEYRGRYIAGTADSAIAISDAILTTPVISHSIDVYIAYFNHQQQGGELVNVMNAVFDHEEERLLKEGMYSLNLRSGQTWELRETHVKYRGGSKRLIWQWYEIAGSATNNNVTAKLFEIRRRLLLPNQHSAAIVVSSLYDISADEARERMTLYLNDMLPALRQSVAH